MRWYEYKMEVDDLQASDDLKARLLAMQAASADTPGARTPAPAPETPPAKKKKAPIRFPARRWAQLAACAAVCGVCLYSATKVTDGGLLRVGGALTSSAESSAASTAAIAPETALYSTADAGTPVYRAADNGIAAYSADNGARSAGGSDSSTLLTSGEAESGEASRSADSAKIIYTANLTLETKDFDAARAALDSALADADGYLESSSEYAGADEARSASLTLRVPQENYQSFLSAAAQIGSVTYKNQQADDVTSQYLDIEARLSNLTAQRDRLQQLQAQADNLSDLLEIESSLSDVQYQLESYQSQLDWYSQQVECCTVYITLDEVDTLTPTGSSFPARLMNALRSGWSGFVSGVQTAVVFLFGCWPAILIGAVCGVIFYRVRHPRKKK